MFIANIIMHVMEVVHMQIPTENVSMGLRYNNSSNCCPQNFTYYPSVSHCMPTPIHSTHLHPLSSELKDAGFNIQKRGQIEVKGKGQMTTYFLLGNLLVSEDSIMGREVGGTCLYKDDLHGKRKKGKKQKKKVFLKRLVSPG